MRHGLCPKCGSANVLRDVRVMDRGDRNFDAGDLSLAVYANPQAWLLKEKFTTALSACVCGACGFTELYAADPAGLAAAAARATKAE